MWRPQVDVYAPDLEQAGRPLLVMHDAHNLNDPATATFGRTWRLVEALEVIPAERRPVVAGVWLDFETDNRPVHRLQELGPQAILEAMPGHDWKPTPPFPLFPSRGDEYLRLIADEVVPTIRQLTGAGQSASMTAVAGSSMGGLASMYAVSNRPEVFGTALCVSTHWKLGGPAFAAAMAAAAPPPTIGSRFWFDHGTLDVDAPYGPSQVECERVLSDLGYRWPQVESRVFVGTGHNEDAWAERLPLMLQWWLDGLDNDS